MDRFLNAMHEEKRSVPLHDLHLLGVTCMFMASKYEDVYPLLMKTVFNKIGHKKIQVETIKNKEVEILKALSFKIGAAPSTL